jgi:pyruvate carboxylase
VDLDEKALEAVSSHFRNIALEKGFPIGTTEEYDLFHYEHQVPGGMMTNLTRQLKELGMLGRLDEVLEEVALVRKELGYPVMATPFSQIVGVQAVENVVSGERYKRVPDTVIKYVMGFYGEAAGPLDPNVLDRILGLPEAQKLRGWQPQGRHKPIEELRREVGPELSDDELLLKILIPGRGAQAAKPRVQPVPSAAKAQAPSAPLNGFPMAFDVEVDGEVFGVKITPSGEVQTTEPSGGGSPKKRKATPPGGVVSGMGGMVVSIKANVGDKVTKGDVLATIEAMKMLREVGAPHGGVVEEICVSDGDMVDSEDLLMVVGLP